MTKKDEKVVAPTVTSLPLPSSDSVLVIDLPDGQKLLVGKMAPGSVIEVATWRGTGRPDSRTNRLMLGMSNGEVEDQNNSVTAENTETINKVSWQYLLYLIRNVPPFIFAMYQKISNRIKSLKKKEEVAPSEYKPEEDVEEWLNRLTKSINDEQFDVPITTEKSTKRSETAKKTRQKKKSSTKSSRKSR